MNKILNKTTLSELKVNYHKIETNVKNLRKLMEDI